MDVAKNNYFTYPVLSGITDDYVNVSFNAGSTGILQKYLKHSVIDVDVQIDDEKIIEMINDGTAKIILKLYCLATKFRHIYDLKLGHNEIEILNKDVNKNVELITLIVLNKNLVDYHNKNFNKDYNNMHFSIEKGSIIAIGKQETLMIEKDINDMTNVSSIVKINGNNKKDMPMMVDYYDENIIISLSAEDFQIYQSYSKYCIPIVISMIVIPALVYVLDEVAKSDDVEEFISKKWFRVIAKRASKILNIEFDINYIKNCGSYELVQKLFENPISEALIMIQNNWNNEEEEDDN